VKSKLNEGSNFSFDVALSGLRIPSSIPTLKNLNFDSLFGRIHKRAITTITDIA
jgi:hypothetical protein